MAYYSVKVDLGRILVIAESLDEVDKKVKEAGIFNFDPDETYIFEYVLP